MISKNDIEAFNERLRKDFDYWDVKTLKRKLRKAETRWHNHPPGKYFARWQSRQVKVDGKWFDLCRTDLKDDVRTWGGIAITDREGKAQVIIKHSFGARVTENTIFVIDAISDG